MRRLIRAAAIILGTWTAVALAPAHVFITGWTRGRGVRVAVLPDGNWLALASAATVVVAGAAAVIWRWRGRSLGQLVDDVTPLAVMSVLAIPYLPFAADVLPGLTVFAGPFRWFVVGAAMVATGWRLTRPGAGTLVHRIDARPAWLLIGAFVAVGTTGLRHTAVQGLGGDEPHYLIITESLLRDGDLRIENNHEQRDHARFIDYDISPDFLQRGRDEVIYSIHAPGLPVLVLPAYLVGGVTGVTVFLSFVAALTGLAVYRLARAVATAGVALATWAAIVFSTPTFVQGWLIFPETPAACIVAWCAWWIVRPGAAGTGAWSLRGLVVAGLPWLHTKFSVLLAMLALALVLPLLARRRWREAIAFAVPVGVSGVSWLLFFYVLYGTLDPTIAYGEGIGATYQLAWANVPRGVLGFLFDQEYGLLPYAPAYLLCVAGIAPLLRQRDARVLAGTGALTGLLFIVATTRYYMWWGGWSVPARFLVPVLPLAAPWLASGIARLSRTTGGRGLAALAIGLSLLVTGLLVARPEAYLAFNDRDGSGKLLEWLQGPAGFTMALPSLLWPDWTEQVPRLGALVGAVVLVLGALWWRDRPEPAKTPDAGSSAAWLLVLFVMALSAATRPVLSRSATQVLVREGQLGLLQHWRPGRFLDVPGARSMSEPDLLARLRIPLYTGGREPGADPMRWLGPWSLPAGRYVAQVWTTPGPPEPGEVVLSFHHSAGEAARRPAAASGPLTVTFDLPAGLDLPPLYLGITNPALAARITRVDLQPKAVTPRHETRARALAVDNLPGAPGTYLAYLDDNAYPENGVFWTRGESRAAVVVVAAPGRTLHIDAHAGDAAGSAVVTVDGRATTVALAAGQALSLQRTVPASGRLRVTVGFSGGFRPSDRGAPDRRWLGLRVLPRIS